MIRDNRELVENQVIGGVLGRELRDQKLWGRVLEGIWLGDLGAIVGLDVGGFLSESWAVAKLILYRAVLATS